MRIGTLLLVILFVGLSLGNLVLGLRVARLERELVEQEQQMAAALLRARIHWEQRLKYAELEQVQMRRQLLGESAHRPPAGPQRLELWSGGSMPGIGPGAD
jgi:hypothetical protein